MRNAFFRWFAFALILTALITSFPLTGVAAELRDYRLPSEKRQGSYPAEGAEVQRADSYREFRAKIEKLSPTQKKQLRESFCEKLKSTKNENEKNYYINLIKIIDESGPTR